MKKLFILLLLLTSAAPVMAQQIVGGHVIDEEDRQPLPGVNIRLLKSKINISSNQDGSFLLRGATIPDTLELSSVGYTTLRLALKTATRLQNLSIQLAREKKYLQEIQVSTGYQSLPRERATGSFTQLDNQKLNEQVSTNILSRLEAATSGLTFNRTTSATPLISVRGLSTINGPKSPLIVLDNFPYEGDPAAINPNDIESITILKDAAAASIWGTRAGNGVIVITSKKAKFNQPLQIELNSNVTTAGKPDLYYTKPISSGDYIDVETMLFGKGYYDSNISSTSHPALSPVVELLTAARAGSITAASAAAQMSALKNYDVRDDFTRYLYSRSLNQQNALTLRGGSANQNWLFSTGYDHNSDNLSAGYQRLSLRLQNTINLLRNLQFSSGLSYSQSLSTNGKPGYGDIASGNGSLYPYARFADDLGNPVAINTGRAQSYLATAGNGKLLDWRYYPLDDYTHIHNQSTTQQLIANFAGNYQVFKFLGLNLQYQYQRQNTDGDNLQDENSYQARSLVNQFTQISGAGAVSYAVPPGGLKDLSHQLTESHNLRGQVNLNPSWGRNEVSAILGAELRSVNASSNTYRLYGYNAANLTYGNADLTKSYPTFVDGSTAFIPDTKSLNDTHNRFVSVFANAAYTYDSKYTLSLSARRDASNIFGANTNSRWNPLGSAGLAWELSKEAFYKLVALPYLRLRVTYGVSGNVDLSRTAVTTIRYSSTSQFTQGPVAVYSNYANPDLQWENIAMLNAGLDFRTRNERLSGSIEYYHKKATNLYGSALIDYTAGVGATITKNAAAMKGDGLDIVLNTINLKGKFSWSSTLNASFYRDEITAYYLSGTGSDGLTGPYPVISGLIGKPVYSVLAYRSAGLDPQTGDPRGYLNGSISKDYTSLYYNTPLNELAYQGSALPTQFGSLSNTFRYRNAFVTAVLSYKRGYFFKRTSIDYGALYTNGQGNADYALRWQKPGDEQNTNVPSAVYPAIAERDAFYAGSESLVEKGDHIRFQYLSGGYEWNQKTLPRLPVRSLQLYFSLSNLGLIWRANKYHIDPDYNYNNSSLNPMLTIAGGIRVNLK